ncbi:GNAT family N-acetyltransferase [Roseomonas elaeocarpi]|uniref:GNAT family N-acetyltransferase n=1 Tax=Roseomonas elaeocarpi TaxID=907779 RepID=A0ABV6JVU3_9PROT
MNTCIRRARPEDAAAIAAVHVAAWQDAYAGLLPHGYLAELSQRRIAAGYGHGMLTRRGEEAVFVAETAADPRRIVGFASARKVRRTGLGGADFAEGEIETLYVLTDYRDRGIGRRLMRASAAHLAAIGCGSAMLWVLSGNNARFFYRHLGGRPVAREAIQVGGEAVEQTALAWNPIETLLAATAFTQES